MAAAVTAAIAHIGNELFSAIAPGIQKDAATGIAGAHVAGDRPEYPRLVDHLPHERSSDTSHPVPSRRIERRVPVAWSGRAVSHDRRLHPFGTVEPALLREMRRLDSFRR